MGYDLHITRKAHWVDDEGPAISADEWRKLIEKDPDLQLDTETRCVIGNTEMVFATFRGEPGVFGWLDGEISTKNPEREVIVKAVQIAQSLGAKVQGDDDEVYGPDGQPVTEEPVPQSAPPRPGLVSRITRWFHHRRAVKKLQQAAPAFKVGDRVRDVYGSTGTVLEVDAKANHGLGRVRIRLDEGGEPSFALVASGLELA